MNKTVSRKLTAAFLTIGLLTSVSGCSEDLDPEAEKSKALTPAYEEIYQTYVDYFDASGVIEAAGGAPTLPSEFHQWLTEAEFLIVQNIYAEEFAAGKYYEGELTWEVFGYKRFEPEAGSIDFEYAIAIETCTRTGGATLFDANGEVVLGEADEFALRRVYFLRETGELRISKIQMKEAVSCEGY
jgi:hypothetical protein